MKKLSILTLLFIGFTFFTSCKDKEEEQHMGDDTIEYQVQIMSPDAVDKKLGDSIHIHVNFDEANNETIHHIKVKIYQADDASNVVYEKPEGAHIHEESGAYQFHDDFYLDAAALPAHKNWILEAKVWGHMAGTHEKIETVEFHVHPN